MMTLSFILFLASGFWLLASGFWLLAAGCWLSQCSSDDSSNLIAPENILHFQHHIPLGAVDFLHPAPIDSADRQHAIRQLNGRCPRKSWPHG
jgi:hypothetical protein